MRIQLWSYNYGPEPTGIAPVSCVLAEGLLKRGHDVDVVAAHPHYPWPEWGRRLLPYREVRFGVPLLRLPLWIGRATATERYRQELTFTAAQFAALPTLRRTDVQVVVSPSFPALTAAIANARTRRIPMVLWLQDILPDGAAATGLVEQGIVLNFARRLEQAAYRESKRIIVPSMSFTENLGRKGVDLAKVHLVHNPATRVPRAEPSRHVPASTDEVRLLAMGNIGFSQGLAPIVRAIEAAPPSFTPRIRLIIAGTGVAADALAREIRSERIEMLGLVDDDRLEQELELATVALVSQDRLDGEFNVPSKLMNFMRYGLPVLAVVHPDSEVARIIRDAGAGWVVDSATPEEVPRQLAAVIRSPEGLDSFRDAAASYAERHFDPDRFVDAFEHNLAEVAPPKRAA